MPDNKPEKGPADGGPLTRHFARERDMLDPEHYWSVRQGRVGTDIEDQIYGSRMPGQAK